MVQFRWKIFARKFACTWNAHRDTKFYNIPQIIRPSRYEQFLKISDQLVVRSLYNNPLNLKTLLKFAKICQIDDVIKGSWRHQRNFKLSLLHPPIYYLSNLGSDFTLSFNLWELFKLQSGTLSVVSLLILIVLILILLLVLIGAYMNRYIYRCWQESLNTRRFQTAITSARSTIFWCGKN